MRTTFFSHFCLTVKHSCRTVKQTGVSKIRENIKNIKTNATIKNQSLFIS